MTTPVGGQLVGDATVTVNANTDPALRALGRFSRDANGRLRNLRGQFVSEGRLINGALTTAAGGGDRFAITLKELKTASLLLSPALIPIAAHAAPIAAGMGAAAAAVGAFAAAAAGQVPAITEAADAEKKYQDAIKEHGRTSKQATDAEADYLRAIEKMPPATQQATASLLVLKEEFRGWSDDLAEFTMVPVTKGMDLTRSLLPKLTPLVRGTSQEFSHFLDVLAGATQTPAFDRLMGSFTEFATGTLSRATTALVRFTQGANTGEIGANLRQFLAYARENGPLVADTFKELLTAATRLLVGFSDLGVSALTAVNALAKLVNAVPASWISTLVQAYAALRLVRLGIAGVTAAASAGGVAQLTAFARAARFGGVGSAIQGVTQRMSLLQKVGGSLGVLGVVAFAIDALADKARGAPPDVDKLTTSLKTLAASGRWTGELKATFGDMDGFIAKIRQIDQGTKELDAAKPFLNLAPGGPIVEQLAGKVDDLVNGTKSLGATKDDLKSFDQSFAAMATSGHASIAAEQFRQFESALKASGKSTEEINALFPEYKAAVAGVKAEQELAAQGMGLFGQQAVATSEKLRTQKASAEGLRSAIQALNDVQRTGLGGMIGFEAAIDAASAAAQENAGALSMSGGQLNVNSEKARTAASALNDLATRTDEAAAAAREQGKSWSDVNGIYARGRSELVKSAMQMGLTRKEAESLAGQILKIPDKETQFKGNIEDLKAKVSQAVKDVKTVPASKRTEMKGKLDDLQAKLAEAKTQIKSVPESKRSDLKATIKDLEGKVAAAKRSLNSVKDRSAAIKGKDQASGIFGAVRRMLDNLDGRTATTYVRTRYSATYDSNAARPFRRDGGPAPKFAGGGMPGGMLRGPGTGTSDSIPMWWGSNGEYVINARSTAKYRSLIEAINEDRLGDGAGVSAGRDVAQGLAAGMRGSRRDVTGSAVALAIAAVAAIRSELEISSPSKKLARIGKQTGQGFIKGLTGTKAQISSTAKAIASAITTAFKGTGSRVDNRLVAMIARTNKRLQALSKDRDKIAAKIVAANKFATDTAARARESGSLASIIQPDYFAPSYVERDMKKSLGQIKAFTANVTKLQKRGLSKNLLRQILEMGPEEGGAFAKALAGADAATIKRYNKLQSGIDAQSKKLGRVGADMLYDSGKKAADGFLTGLKAQQKKIESLMLSIAKGMQKAIRKALGIRSPSRVMAAVGRMTVLGLEGGITRMVPAVDQAMARIAGAVTSGAPTALPGMPGGAALPALGVGAMRTGSTAPPVVYNATYHFHAEGPVGSRTELQNWFVKSLDDVARTGRIPKALRSA